MYSDKYQTTLTYLRDTKFNINNTLIWTRNFNIRDSNWYPTFLYHFTHTDTDTINEIVNNLNLEMSTPTLQILTRYTNNENNTDTIIDLIFL